MTEEKAPSPLPDLLPVGTIVRPFGDSRTDETTEPARLHSSLSGGGRYAGADDYTIRCKGGNWGVSVSASDTRMIDWSSVTALRTPPSPPSEGPYVPKPGERVTVTAIKPGFTTDIWQVGATIEVSRAVLRGDGWVRVTGTIDGVSMACENDCHVSLSAPSADKWEPKPGDFVRIVDPCGSPLVRGDAYRVDSAKRRGREGGNSFDLLVPGQPHAWAVLIEPATPSPKAEEATLPPCQHRNVNLYTMRCDDCGMTAAQAADRKVLTPPVDNATERLDPYKEHRLSLEYGSAVEFSNVPTLDQRIAAAKAQHLADFDRPLATVAVGGRFGKRVGLVNENWPSQENED